MLIQEACKKGSHIYRAGWGAERPIAILVSSLWGELSAGSNVLSWADVLADDWEVFLPRYPATERELRQIARLAEGSRVNEVKALILSIVSRGEVHS